MNMYLPSGFKFHEDTMGVTQVAAFIPEIWAQSTLKNIYSKSAMIGSVSKDYQSEIAAKGDVVHVQKRGLLRSYEKTEGNPVTLQNPTGGTVPVTLTNHKEVSFLVEDVAEAQATPSILDGYTADAALVLAKDIEDNLTSIYADGRYAVVNDLDWDPTDGDSKLASMIALRTSMIVDGKLPEDAPRYCVIRDYADFLDVDKFVSKEFLTQDSIETGTVGKILGFNVKESSEIVTTVSPVRVHRLAFAQSAICLVTRQLPDPPVGSGAKGTTVTADGVGMRALLGYNMSYLGLQATVDILFGSQIMEPQFVFQLLDK